MIYQVDVRIFAPVNETEIPERVIDAIHNVFPTAELRETEDGITGTAHSLSTLSEHLHRRAILDTARSEFFNNQRPNGFSFSIKKQPAFKNVVTFTVGNPGELGEIDVDVHVEDPDVESVIDHIAPPTEDGVPITPDDDR